MPANTCLPNLTLVVALAILTCLAGGCSETITLADYPDFYERSLTRIGVVPFGTSDAEPSAGRVMAAGLARALRANGTYRTVVGPGELQGPTSPDAAAADEAALIDRARQRDCHAVIAGVVTSYATFRDRYTDVSVGGGVSTGVSGGYGANPYDWPDDDPMWGRPGLWGAYPYGHWSSVRVATYVRNEADVAVTARLIDLRSGQVLHAIDEPLGVAIASEGNPPRLSVREALADARQRLIDRLLDEFAVVDKEIEIQPDKVLRLAARKGDDYADTTDFAPDSSEMFVLLDLPTLAHRNELRLIVTVAGRDDPLLGETVTWQREWTGQGRVFQFSPAEIHRLGQGADDYTVKLRRNGEVLLEKDFEIE
jgi:hypothetical protein